MYEDDVRDLDDPDIMASDEEEELGPDGLPIKPAIDDDDEEEEPDGDEVI